MQVSSLGSLNGRNVSFGFNVYGDCGASIPEQGTMKMTLGPKDKSQQFALKEGIVCPKGILSVEDFLGGIANNIAAAITGNMDKLPENDRELENIAMFIPAQARNNRVKIISNLRVAGTGEQLHDLDFNDIQGMLAARGVKVSDNFKLVVANDMYGAVAGVLSKVLQEKDKYADLLQAGCQNIIVMPGGGLGVGKFEVDVDRIRISSEESGHIKPIANQECLEADGASVPALIRNFAKALGLSDTEQETLVKTGNAKIPTQHHVWMDDGSEEYNRLMDTGLFEHTESKDGKAYLMLKKDGKPISEDEFTEASKYSVGKFVDDIANLCAIKVNAKAKSVLLTGKLIDKINKDIARIPVYEGKSIEQLITEKIPEHLDSSGQSLFDTKEFRVIYLKMDDNTSGGSLVLNGKPIGDNDWMDIPYTPDK